MDKDFVKFRLRERKDGIKSIFLSFYYKGKRHEESLRLYIVPELTREDKKKNKDTWAIAESVRARRLMELQEEVFRLKSEKPAIQILDLWRQKIGELGGDGTRATWVSAYNKMEMFLNKKDIPISDVDVKFCEEFKKYLSGKATVGNRMQYEEQRLKSNSQLAYYAKFRALLHYAHRMKYIDNDPSESVSSPKREDSERTYLTIEELHSLVNTPCLVDSVRVCFLFSCLTGLRRCDVQNLRWCDVSSMGGLTRITFKQQKTKGLLYLDINEQASALMGERKEGENYVLPRLPDPHTTNRAIRAWAKKAGITKHISFHSGRHTFATLMLSLNTDLYTVSKLLGHANINTTQIYAKVLDKNKQEAVKKIPRLNL